MKQQHFIFWALAARGAGLSGSDRIFIELARRWSKRDLVELYVWNEGYQMCQRSNLNGPHLKYQISNLSWTSRWGFVFNYLAVIVESIRLGLTRTVEDAAEVVNYSASDFWMDVFPAVLLKWRYPRIKWVATWYQTAPNPIVGFREGRRQKTYRLNALWYWLVQQPVKVLISRFADMVIVNNQAERSQFPELNRAGRVQVLIGAVDLAPIKAYRQRHPRPVKQYEAIFQGRFHPQKGVVELVQIWSKVVKRLPTARLVMIGDGPLRSAVEAEIMRLKLTKSIILVGYLLDGPRKYQLMSQSKVVVHPAYFDSGGMAAAEAMAFDLPVVAFDLKAYQSYYPKGMRRAPIGDQAGFAELILQLLSDESQRRSLGREAGRMIYADYSWDQRARELAQAINQQL